MACFIVDASSLGLLASAQSPAEGEVVTAPPTDFIIDFSDPYDAATVDASDLTVNGIAAGSFTLTDADTVTFRYSASPVTSQGMETVPTTGPLASLEIPPGSYRISVSGQDGTTGGYSASVILNAAVEDEQHGGSANDSLATVSCGISSATETSRMVRSMRTTVA